MKTQIMTVSFWIGVNIIGLPNIIHHVCGFRSEREKITALKSKYHK
jgi:hypothetical protein